MAPCRNYDDDDDVLDATETAKFFGITLVSLWRGVASVRLPRPFYAAARSPRWPKATLRETRERLQMLPQLGA